jgi:sugar phosphate isomerase/epimerase
MRLGFRRFNLFGNDWEAAFSFAKRIGAQSIQLDNPAEDDVTQIKEQMDRTGISISSIGAMSWQMLGPNVGASLDDQAKVKKAISLAEKLGVSSVSQFAGNDPNKTFTENIDTFKKVFTPLAQYAEAAGVRLAFENCPLIDGTPPVVRNLAYSPASWDAMFNAIPSEAVGLEFDTAHFVFLGIDMERCIDDYADKIVHVHFKDCKIIEDSEYKFGRLGNEYYHYCIPGEGDVNYERVIHKLKDIGYNGDLTLDLRPTTEEAIIQGVEYTNKLLKKING